MPSPTTPTPADIPAAISPGSADAVSDLPNAIWPALQRIAVVDLVGPAAANRQHRVLQKRTKSLVDNQNKLVAIANLVVGAVALPGNYSRIPHTVASVPLTAGAAQVSDDLEHYLARDGSSIMWGRLALGSPRSLLYTNAFDGTGKHWVQGPGCANVGLGDVDLAWGVHRLAANDYNLYVLQGGLSYRVLTTLDFGGGSSAFLASASNNARVVSGGGGADLHIEASNVTPGVVAQLGVTITGQDDFTIAAVKGTAGRVALLRNGTGGFIGELAAWETASYPFAYVRPLSVSTNFAGHGIAIAHTPHATVTSWGGPDYRYEAIQLPYAGNLRITFGAIESVRASNGQDDLSNAGNDPTVAIMSQLSVVMDASGEPASGTKQPRIGFERRGVNQCSLYYNGISGGLHHLRVRGNNSFDDRLAYISEVSAPSPSPAAPSYMQLESRVTHSVSFGSGDNNTEFIIGYTASALSHVLDGTSVIVGTLCTYLHTAILMEVFGNAVGERKWFAIKRILYQYDGAGNPTNIVLYGMFGSDDTVQFLTLAATPSGTTVLIIPTMADTLTIPVDGSWTAVTALNNGGGGFGYVRARVSAGVVYLGLRGNINNSMQLIADVSIMRRALK